MEPELLDAVVCPRCGHSPLGAVGRSLQCSRCSNLHPLIATIPCLVPRPQEWQSHWLARLDEYLAATNGRIAELEQQAANTHDLARTRDRVARVAEALARQRDFIQLRFTALAERLPRGASLVPPQPQSSLAVLRCYEHLFRDWCWGDAENQRSLELIERVAPHALGRTAVFGAGAGRLALELHRRLGCDMTFALDVNPLPLLVASELLRGGEVELPEFPMGPHSDRHFVVNQKLRPPAPVPPNFQFAFADALEPPFAPRSLDTVVTPWFIDATGVDLRQTLAVINRVLRADGLWIQLGPLRFEGPLASVFMIEDVFDLTEQAGFTRLATLQEDVPYFDSPIAGSRRIETVFCFAARKVAEPEAPTLLARGLPWLVDPALPIPMAPELRALQRTSVFTVGVLSLIDGSRSLDDLATVLAGKWGMPKPAVALQLRTFFERLFTSL